MQYIIMCGGNYHSTTPRQLHKIHDECIIERTIRLLRKFGVEDIAISSNDERFAQFGVPILHHVNDYDTAHQRGNWVDAFYPTNEAACYIFGDVLFSYQAVQTIVETETNDIEFFASAPPFSSCYIKSWAEPFALKVVNQDKLQRCIRIVKRYYMNNRFKREPIMWELWQIIKGTQLNSIDYTNYTAINDYTCDIETVDQIKLLEEIVEE